MRNVPAGAIRCVLLSLALAAACAQDGGVAGVLVVSRIDVAPPGGAIIVGHSLQLTAIPKTEGGIVLPAINVVWSSTNEQTASVTPEGLVQTFSVGGPVRIRATMSGVTGETQITVVPVPVDHVVVTPPTTGITIGQSTQLTATAFDAAGTELQGRVFLWGTAAPGIAAVTTTGMVLGMGVGGPVNVTATSEGKTGGSAVTVSRRPASRLGFLQQPTTTVAGAAITPAVRVAVQDELLGTVTDATNPVTLSLGANPGGSTLSGTLTVAAVAGVATFTNLSLNRTGTGYALVAASPGLVSATSSGFGITAGTANRLSFTVAPPATAKSGVAFAASPVVQVRDAGGNAVPGAGVVIAASVQPAGGTLGGTAVATTTAGGAATFTGLSIAGLAGPYTLTFAAAGLTPLASGSIALSAGNPAALSLTTQPAATAQSGVVLSRQPVVRLRDQAGNPVSQAGVPVTAAIETGPAGGTLGGTIVVSTSGSGTSTFTNLVLSGPVGSYTLRFSAPGLPVVLSNAVVLGAGSGSVLAIAVPPASPVQSGIPFPTQPAIQLRDAAGNPVAQAGVPINASIQTGAGTLGGGTTATTNASGRATFGNLRITGTTGNRTLLFAAAGYVSVPSGLILVAAGPAAKLAVSVQPSAGAQNGVPFPQQPVVQLQDASGNPVGQAGTTITASLASGPAGGSLGGTLAATTNAGGAATWSSLSVTGPAGAYTIAFAGTALTGATANPVTLVIGSATGLVIATQPSSAAVNGAVFLQQPVAQLVNGSGTPVSQAGVPVSVALSGAGGTLGGVSTVNTDASGRAVFAGLSITGKAGSYALAFSSPGKSGTSSAGIALGAGPASQSVVVVQPSSPAQSGVKLPQQPAVQVTDVSGNPVGGVVVTAAIASGGGALGGTSTATSDASGIAAFTDLSIAGTIGPHTLGFTTPGTQAVTSNPIDLVAGPAALLVSVQEPSSSALRNTPFAQQPILRLLDASGNGVAGASVTAAINSALGNGKLAGTLSITTDASGYATFTDLAISRAGVYTLKFTFVGLPPVVSSSITVL